jgi:hypothetical protein
MSLRPIALWRGHGSQVFLFAVLSSSLALNVILGLKLTRAGQADQADPIVGVQQRATLERIPVLDGQGTSSTLVFDGQRPTVLYVLAPKCPWCARNLANIRALAVAKAAEYRFIGLSNTDSGFTDYAKTSLEMFPLYRVDADALRRRGQANFLKEFDPTPQMIVIDRDGQVRKVWIGALQGSMQSDVERFFKVELPGLLDPAVAAPSLTP